MNVSGLQTYVVPERLDKALKVIRAALREVELEVLDEFPLSRKIKLGPSRIVAESRILLVSCPILEFEAVALARAAAAMLPLHVLVTGEQNQTTVSVVNPASLFEGRIPVGASGPMERLVARVELALDSIEQRR